MAGARQPPKPPGEGEARPSLTVVNPEGEGEGRAPEARAPRAPAERVVMAPTAADSRKGYSGTEAPIATAMSGTPGVTRWRVMRDVAGDRVFLGYIATHAQPEALIDAFPGGMPLPGQVGLYFLRGINAENKETGHEYPFRISGDSPEVQQARRALVGTPAAAAAPAVAPAVDAALAELRRQTEALALERRELADRRVADERDRATQIRAESEARIAQIREEGRLALEAEKARREQDRADTEMRLKADREERDRREAADRAERERKDRLEREERQDRDKRAEEERKADREREREHREKMAKLEQKASLEGILATAATFFTTVGIKPKELIDKVLGGENEGAKGTAEVVAEAVSTGVQEIGLSFRTWMELEAGKRPGGNPTQRRQETPPKERRRIEAAPDTEAPEKAPEAAGGASPAPARNAALDAIPMPLQRKARGAMRELIAELRDAPEAEIEGRVTDAIARVPALFPYVKAVGVKAALVEGGLTAAEADKVVAKIPAGALG